MTRIMVVDDEESILILVKEVLEQEGFQVDTASDGKECLNKLKTVKPDLIVLDMMMPGMTGKDVLEKIRENPETKKIKVIFLTVARMSEVGKKEVAKLGISDYITKPFDNNDLVDRVKKALK
ncbi:MAG: response regulator [Candidatus Aenigmatarchaeota archaeon]|nr:response regulator [Candidatus Aenigmarchaeota archaeon]